MSVKAEGKINKSTFYPGEKILFSAIILNCTGKTIPQTYVRLVQVSFRFNNPSSASITNDLLHLKVFNNYIFSMSITLQFSTISFKRAKVKKFEKIIAQYTSYQNLEDNDTLVWNNVAITIPPCRPSGLSNSGLIKISYALEVIFTVPFCYIMLKYLTHFLFSLIVGR